MWHHGTPQTGALIAPLLERAAKRGIRMVSYARPSYGGSTPNPGRDVASAARDVEQVADAFRLGRFAVMGASGGGPHALACAALLGDRVSAVATLAGIAPYTEEFVWFEGMVAPQALRAARQGREARAALPPEFDEGSFTARDWAVLEDRWKPLGEDAGKAGAAGPEGAIDDDLAFASAWGFELERIAAPVLLAHVDRYGEKLEAVVGPGGDRRAAADHQLVLPQGLLVGVDREVPPPAQALREAGEARVHLRPGARACSCSG